MRILTVVGARPQFIKAATISRVIIEKQRAGADLSEVLVHTGQHYDEKMSDLFFEEMDIPTPKYNLGIHGSSHGKMTGDMLGKIEDVLLKENPDIVMVYGDTNSTIAGALAAAKLHIPVAHVEAGLRSFNMSMPEEINRILTDQLSTWLFCPTPTAVENLRREGFFDEKFQSRSNNPRVFNVGDVMFDAMLYYRDKARPSDSLLSLLSSISRKFALATIHRAENTDDPLKMRAILSALEQISRDMPILLPLHPRTKKVIDSMQLEGRKNIIVIDPVGYFDMMVLLDRCQIVLTDSGGLQKEAYFFGRPCVTLREETEWVELVETSANILGGTDPNRICMAYETLINSSIEKGSAFGDGRSAEKILALLCGS